MINQVVLSRLHRWRCAKVYTIFFACLLDVLVRSRQAQNGRVEFSQVFLEHFGRIARGVAGNHDGNEDIAALLFDLLVHQSHLVELVGADVRAVREAEVDLMCCQSMDLFSREFQYTYQRVSA